MGIYAVYSFVRFQGHEGLHDSPFNHNLIGAPLCLPGHGTSFAFPKTNLVPRTLIDEEICERDNPKTTPLRQKP